ncbi:thiamine pyrophosphate-binding protein [Halobacterium zhouii]|uniref:thiamine pyrophosphate-binding protein n=1 Tax=Halobacterium zhouii TaxID=2902624 RepID=UPI001E2E4D28|nr:thiamine pyrophosphate-binding protein [Halobacterium zhouii]
MTTTAAGIAAALDALDTEYVFGFPGGRVIEVFEALAHTDADVEVVRPRDEREASVMAEVHGRLTGEPGVLAGQGPWVGSIGAFGQMEARLGSSPMVVITEASERGEYSTLAPYQQARGDYGGVDVPQILDAVTKEVWEPRTPTETLRTLGLAFKHATAGRPGPTAVVLDGDAVTEDVPSEPEPPLWEAAAQARTWESRPTAEDVADAADALEAADRPVIIAGNGVHAAGAYDDLRAVADAYDCVVTTSYLGKSTIPETHDRAAGVIGSFGHEGANRVVSEADTLLVVGCRLNPMDANWLAPSFVRPDEQTILHADVDPRNTGWVYPADVGLVGDAKESLSALAEAGGSTNDWALDRAADARTDFHVSECDDDSAPIKPQRAVQAIDDVVDEDTLVTADSGNNRFWLLNYLQVPSEQGYIGSGGVGGMGWAAPAAVSAALTTDRNVISVTGDGGFAMSATAVETAVEYGVAPTFVVLNDAGLGMVRQMDDAIPGTTFRDTDYVALAEAYGADAERVTEPADLDRALRDAKAADAPTVLDVRIDPDEPMAESLQSSFYAAVGGLHE